jgi:hypothetical protein
MPSQSGISFGGKGVVRQEMEKNLVFIRLFFAGTLSSKIIQ